mmetsp:Transcript_35290/g.33516  ORF Transcript_35290/g.33516 Transcript_35290/m.33516 type:complete len:144 (-) Transcript_35290:190-621(-)
MLGRQGGLHLCYLIIQLLAYTSAFVQKTSYHRNVLVWSKPTVTIEYCTGCKWLLRSAWLAQELLTTFEKDIDSVSLKPNNDSPGGVFVVRVDGLKVWDRREEETKGFPEAKVLKQLVRDVIDPSLSLGFSDRTRKAIEFIEEQ